ncbi:MAG: hypothetical protein R3B09_17525 [Nannocystaceae bacterium]
MKRRHLFEFEDLPWLPTALRDMVTGLLGRTLEFGRLYHPVAPLLARALRATGERSILDLCSGGGGPVSGLRRRLAREHGLAIEVRLSDLYPNAGAFEHIAAGDDGGITFEAGSVDATAVPGHLGGFRTMFSCFHHFRPREAEAILRDAFTQGRGVGIFEVTERSPAGVAQAMMGPLAALVLTPFVRPFRISRLLLTYLVPVVPALFLFDGVVSNLRTYTPDELRAMTASMRRADYRWEIGQVRHPVLPTRVTYVLGLPQPPEDP